jgi:hypothetical protein
LVSRFFFERMNSRDRDFGDGGRSAQINLALLCQKYTRAKIGREKFLLKRWETYNHAAFKIQEAYRRWRMTQITRRRIKYKIGNKIKQSFPGNPGKCWANVIENKGTHAEKMAMWRNIVELRRAHRNSSTELCIKALVQTHGELSKAITLLGSSEFGFQSHFGPPLPEDIKESLNPYRKSSALRDEELELLLRQRPNSSFTRRAHRHLQQTLQTSAKFTRDAYDLEGILLKSYYTKGNAQEQSKPKGTGPILNPLKPPPKGRHR